MTTFDMIEDGFDRLPPLSLTRYCAHCGEPFMPKVADSPYCQECDPKNTEKEVEHGNHQ